MKKLLFACALAACATASAFADGTTGALRGRVLDDVTMKPAPNVAVAVTINNETFETYTAKDGSFAFMSLPVTRRAWLIANPRGSGGCLSDVRVSANQTTDVGAMLALAGDRKAAYDCLVMVRPNPGVTSNVYNIR